MKGGRPETRGDIETLAAATEHGPPVTVQVLCERCILVGAAFHRRPQTAVLRGDGDCSAGAYVTTPRYGSFKDLGVLMTSSTICCDK